MKKSEMRDRLAEDPTESIDKILNLMEAVGVIWDKEEDDWPELGLYPVKEGYLLGIASKDPRFSAGAMRSGKAASISSRWNSRRPGGPMEKVLLAIASMLERDWEIFTKGDGPPIPFTMRADQIRGALKVSS